jgi:hypothetical protein
MMKRTALALLLIAGTVAAAQADTFVFRDVLKPGGKARSMAAKQADGRKCGATNGFFPTRDTAQFTACMSALGWTIAKIKRSPPSEENKADPADTTVVHFDDQRRKADGHWRGNGALQSDTRRCSGYGARDYESHGFIHCMASAGWRHESTHHAKRPAPSDDDDYNPPPIDTSDNAPPPTPAPPPPMQYDVITGQPLP